MGDLPGSPSVAPSPLFLHGSVGGGRRDCPGGCGTALRGRPGASTRRRRGQIGGQHRRPRRCLHRSTQRRRWPRNLRLFVRLLPSFLFLFPPAFFCFRARGVAPGAQLAESGAGPRSGRVVPLRAAPPRRGEQTLGRSVSDRALLVAALPSPTAR
jgi:hypothetical protein